MALDKTILATAIVGKIEILTSGDKEDLQKIWEAVAGEIILHIQTAGVVTVAPGIAVATAGSAAAQTGATTAPGTGTIS